MSSLLSTKNPFYTFKVIDNSADFLQEKKKDSDLIVSYYVCNGELAFKYQDKNIKIFKDQLIICLEQATVPRLISLPLGKFAGFALLFGLPCSFIIVFFRSIING